MTATHDTADTLLRDLITELAGELTAFGDTPLIEVFGEDTRSTWAQLNIDTAADLHELLQTTFTLPSVTQWPTALVSLVASALRDTVGADEAPDTRDCSDPTAAAASRAHDGLVLVATERDLGGPNLADPYRA